MDDGRNRLSHDAGCVVAGAAFFGYFLSLPKESNTTHATKKRRLSTTFDFHGGGQGWIRTIVPKGSGFTVRRV